MNTAAASSSRGVAAATTGTSSEREDFLLFILVGSRDHSVRFYSPKSVFTDVVCLETLSANRRREYSVLGVRWKNVCCHWSGNKDEAGEKQEKK